MRYGLFVLARFAVALFVLCTWAYGVATYSPFAFDMFVRPQLFPLVNAFVAWHHVWYWAAYLVSVATLASDLRPPAGLHTSSLVRWSAVGYTVVFGVVGAYLLADPLLPRLWNDIRSLAVVVASVVPLLWLAAIDHFAARGAVTAAIPSHHTGQRRLLAACAATAVYLSLTHFGVAVWSETRKFGGLEWIVSGAWAVTLNVVTLTLVYLALSLVAAAGATRRQSGAWEYGLTVALAAAGVCEFTRRTVLPSVAFDSRAAVPVSIALGIAVAATWSGWVLRRNPVNRAEPRSTLDRLLVPRLANTAAAVFAMAALPLIIIVLLEYSGRFDWGYVIHRSLVLAESVLAFTLCFHVCRHAAHREWSAGMLVMPAVVAGALLYGVPAASTFVADAAGDEHLDPKLVVDRHGARDPLFGLIASAVVAQPEVDADYHHALLNHSTTRADPSGATAAGGFADPRRTAGLRRPHIFLFVIDSLRRDYVSPYNPAVTFTPNIDAFARENFAFTNAFTPYGGTWLAMPSIWIGGSVARGLNREGFQRMNALEQLIGAEGYRLVINDHTVAEHLKPSTPLSFLDPQVPSVDTDLCQLLGGLVQNLDASTMDPRPMLAFLAPMNVHILNTRRDNRDRSAGTYPGFHAPYASRLARVDGCFGDFISHLKRRNLYDNSIIAITSDHGDSLGEEGRWGHQFWLFPEDIRIPLIVRIPPAQRPSVTTDLSRIAFLTDITPTLYALLGHRIKDAGSLFGAPLFVPVGDELTPRRRESVLIMSSYGPNYGLLRRNGREMYVTDLVAWRELAFDLSDSLLGRRVAVTNDARRINQRLIRERVGAVAALYHAGRSSAASR